MSASVRVRDLALSLIAGPGLAVVTLLLLFAQALARVVPQRPAGITAKAACARMLSLVVATREGGQEMERTLQSVAAIAGVGIDLEVVVVGPKRSIEGLNSSEILPHLRLLRSDGGSLLEEWQQGIEAAIGSLVVLLVDGVELGNVSLQSLTKAFEDEQLFACSPTLESAVDRAEPSLSGGYRGDIRNGEIRFWNALPPEADRHPSPILWAAGIGCALRRDRFLELGGFDPQFGSPDSSFTDLCFRAWKRGWPVIQGSAIEVRLQDWHGRLLQHDSPDLERRDQILFAWKNLSSPGILLQTQLALAAQLLSDGARGQLNLRPLRLALKELRRMAAHRLRQPAPRTLSDREVFDRSSLRLACQSAAPRDRGTMEPATLAKVAAARAVPVSTSEPSPLKMLLVCPQLPYPPSHGSAVRMWNVLKVLAERNRLDLLSFYEPNLQPDEVDVSVREMERYCGEVRVVPRRPVYRPSLLDRTVHVEQFDCPTMREELRDMVERNGYDVIQIDKTEMAQYALPQPAPIQLLIEHIIFYHAYRRQFLTRDRVSLPRLVEYFKLRHFELEACRHFDGIITMSRVDTDFLRSRLPDHRCIVDSPNGVDLAHYRYIRKPAEGQDILFIGNFDHSPNVDGVRYFLKEVFPLIKAKLPDVKLWIVGPGPYHTLPEVAAEPQAVSTGFVDDTWPYMARCSVLVAPILAGSGTRLKILEAMASGLPVVTTTVGIEGIQAGNGVHAMICDGHRDFAHSVVKLLRNRGLRETMRSNARRLMEDRYDWHSIGLRLEDTCRTLIRDRDRRPVWWSP